MTQNVLSRCLTHQSRVIIVCMAKGCQNSFLCRLCHREHSEDHESDMKDILEFQENPEWIKVYEQEKDLLLTKGKKVYSSKDALISKYSRWIGEMINQIIAKLEKHKDKLIKELITSHFSESDESFSQLKQSLRILEEFSFRDDDGDNYWKVAQVKEFSEKLAPSTIHLIEIAEKKLTSTMLRKEKLDFCQEEFIGFIESVKLIDFNVSASFGNLKQNDVISTSKDTKQGLTQAFENTQHRLAELEGLHNNLIQEQDLLKVRNQDLIQINHNLESQLENLARDNNRIQDQNVQVNQTNTDLANQLADLNSRVTKLSDESSYLSTSLEMAQYRLVEVEGLNSNLIQEKSRLTAEKEDLAQLRNKLENQLESLIHQHTRVQDHNLQLMQANVNLINQLANLSSESTTLNQSLKNTQHRLTELQKLNINLIQSRDDLQSQLETLRDQDITLRGQNGELNQAKVDLNNQIANLSQENARLSTQIRDLGSNIDDLSNEVTSLKDELKILKPWTWSSTKKSTFISLTENSMQASKIFSANSACVVGSKEMFQGCHRWHIEISTRANKSGLVFGVIEPHLVNLEELDPNHMLGLAVNAIFFRMTQFNSLPDYDNKTYLCTLDFTNNSFTISHAGTVICKQDEDLKNKRFVPCVYLYRPGNTVTLRQMMSTE